MPKEIDVRTRRTSGVVEKQPAIESKVSRRNIIQKMIDTIRSDIHEFISRKKEEISRDPEKWEDYQRFCEIARGKR